MAFVASVYPLDAGVRRRFKLAGMRMPTAPSAKRGPTPKDVKDVLHCLADYEVHLANLSPGFGWQAQVWHRRRPALHPWVFIAFDQYRGDETPEPFRFVRGTPELMVRIVEELAKRLGALVLHPEGKTLPLVVEPNADAQAFLTQWHANQPPPVKRPARPSSLRPGEVDLNSGMIEAVLNPPKGYVSKYSFRGWSVEDRLPRIKWFAKCGTPDLFDLSVPVVQVPNWERALAGCSSDIWSNVQLEARNQLTIWLHNNDNENYQNWNRFARDRNIAVLDPLMETQIRPFQCEHGLPKSFADSVQWDLLGVLMEDIYSDSGHIVFFCHELLTVYEAGHFPCGWTGEWPNGELLMF